jgi:hypothetical protein
VLSTIKKRIESSIGRRIFRRAIRGAIPDYVSDVRAVENPIPFIRPGTWPLVAFSYREPFERDVLVTGWEDYTNRPAVALVVGVCAAHGTGVHPGRVYTRWSPGEQTRAWLILDASGSRGCFYLTGIDSL